MLCWRWFVRNRFTLLLQKRARGWDHTTAETSFAKAITALGLSRWRSRRDLRFSRHLCRNCRVFLLHILHVLGAKFVLWLLHHHLWCWLSLAFVIHIRGWTLLRSNRISGLAPVRVGLFLSVIELSLVVFRALSLALETLGTMHGVNALSCLGCWHVPYWMVIAI
jgi:hypothetical protein